MFATVLAWLGHLLGGPFAKAAVDAYKARLDSENSADAHTADLAARELAVQQRELELQTELRKAQIGQWYEPEKIIGYGLAFYFCKIYVFDAALHLGSTDAVHGAAGDWAGLIIMFYFGKRGFENIARILKR